jgi:hypothetical protein
VRLGATSIIADLLCPAIGAEPAQLCFEQRAGWILARFDAAGWTAQLPAAEAELLSAALLGLYKMSGVELVSEQIEAQFAPVCTVYEVRRNELVAWPGDGFEAEVIYHWTDGRMIPCVEGPAAASPVLNSSEILLERLPVEWASWVRAWEPDPAGVRSGTAKAVLHGWCILPSDLARRRVAGQPDGAAV